MAGISRQTASVLSEREHLRQSVIDILTTPIGSRVMRRTYGSDLPALIDAPMSDALRVDIFAAAANALRKWEPRLEVTQVFLSFLNAGHFNLTILGRDKTGQNIQIEDVIL